MQKEIDNKEEVYRRTGREYEEFRALYPDVPISTLPDDVWADVVRGVPIAAAYALAARKQALLQKSAEESNRKNAASAPDGVNADPSHLYSPSEVRAMNAEEVRANYDKIIESMTKWN